MEEEINYIELINNVQSMLKEVDNKLQHTQEQINNISKIQSIHNDSLLYIINKLNESSDTYLLSKLNTINAKLNDDDLVITNMQDNIEEIKNKIDNLPEQFQMIFDLLTSLQQDKSRRSSNPVGGIIIG